MENSVVVNWETVAVALSNEVAEKDRLLLDKERTIRVLQKELRSMGLRLSQMVEDSRPTVPASGMRAAVKVA